jgi:hypothetical protein
MYTIALAMALPFALIGVPLAFSIILAPFFLLFFKHMENKQKLVVPRTIKVLMWLSIGVVILWFAARVYASAISIDGAIFVVSSFGAVTLIPAISLLLFLDIIVLFKSYGIKVGQITLAIVILAGAVRAAVPYINDHSNEVEWQKYCQTAKDEINVAGENIVKVEFYQYVGHSKFSKNEDGQMRINGTEYLGEELIKRGVLNEYEVMASGNIKHYRFVIENGEQLKIPINESSAAHRVSKQKQKYSTGSGSESWIEQQTISVTNTKTGKIVAKRVQFINSFKGLSCAQTYNDQISAVDFLEKIIRESKE